MLSLGIDPGTATIGYGLVREQYDGSLQAVDYGVITTPASLEMNQRLRLIFEHITDLVQVHKPDRAAVEELFFARNVTTAITVAQGRGVILLALTMADIPLTEYKPNMVKQSITGYGGSPKSQMQEMIRMLLGLDAIPRPDDAADALAVAITDIHASRFAGLMS